MKFLIKEIKSKTGELHFRRYRLFSCSLFSIFIHRIYKSDEDLHPHSHPWNFLTVILWGGYKEKLWTEFFPEGDAFKYWPYHFFRIKEATRGLFSVAYRKWDQYHNFELIKTTTTLVITGRRIDDDWGYLVDGTHIQHKDYRNRKNNRDVLA